MIELFSFEFWIGIQFIIDLFIILCFMIFVKRAANMKVSNQYDGKSRIDQENSEKTANEIIEMLEPFVKESKITADSFDLEFGFNWDWNLYRDTLLPYLAQFPWRVCFEDRIGRRDKKRLADDIPIFAEGSYEKERFDYYLMRLLAVYWQYQISQTKARSVDAILNNFLAEIKPSLLGNIDKLTKTLEMLYDLH